MTENIKKIFTSLGELFDMTQDLKPEERKSEIWQELHDIADALED